MGEKILRYLFDGPGKDRWTNMTLNILRTKRQRLTASLTAHGPVPLGP